MACCPNRSTSDRIKINVKDSIVTEKFYARHDNILELKNLDPKRVEVYKNLLSKQFAFDARNEYLAPITTNQTYGWLAKYADNYTGLDAELFDFRLPYDPLIVILTKTAGYKR